MLRNILSLIRKWNDYLTKNMFKTSSATLKLARKEEQVKTDFRIYHLLPPLISGAMNSKSKTFIISVDILSSSYDKWACCLHKFTSARQHLVLKSIISSTYFLLHLLFFGTNSVVKQNKKIQRRFVISAALTTAGKVTNPCSSVQFSSPLRANW